MVKFLERSLLVIRATIVLGCITVATMLMVMGGTDPVAQMSAAARSNDIEQLEQSISHGAPVDCRDVEGLTPLMQAARAGHVDAVKFLLDKGADIDARSEVLGTAAMVAALNGRHETLHVLLDYHANPNSSNGSGVTSLMYAAMAGDHSVEMVAMLLDAGADVRAQSNCGWNALAAAEESENQEVAKMLKKARNREWE